MGEESHEVERNLSLAARAGYRLPVGDDGRLDVLPGERSTALLAGPPDPKVHDFGGATDLPGLAAVLRNAAAVVVGDAVPAHLAAAVGTPVVSVFPHVRAAAGWRPWRVPHVLLGQQDIGCAGCQSVVCPVAGQPCIGGVRVDDVVAAVLSLAGAPLGEHSTEAVG